MIMEAIQITDVVLIAVIIGLVEIASRAGLPKKAAPTLSLVLGVAGGIVYIAPGDPKTGVIVGIIMALSSMGLYSGTKNTLGK
jgi:hypothetical protein